MKNLSFYITTLLCVFFTQVKSQTDLYSSIQVNTLATDYTVSATFDTTFAREVVVTLNNTDNIQSVNASLKIKSETGWDNILAESFPTSGIQSSVCNQPLCIYKRQSNVWVIFLGNHPLYTSHAIELHFELVSGNGTPYDWRDEF
jgi:hypothetical protein